MRGLVSLMFLLWVSNNRKATLEYWAAPHDSLGGEHADGATKTEIENSSVVSEKEEEWMKRKNERQSNKTKKEKNDDWWTGIRPKEWVPLNQKQHVIQAQAHQRARLWPCARSWAEKGHIHLQSQPSLDTILNRKNVSIILYCPFIPIIHPKFAEFIWNVTPPSQSAFHPSIPPFSHYEYGPVS